MATGTNPYDELDIPEYPELIRAGIYCPAALVAHAIERGEIRPAPRTAAQPRCPSGKKAEWARQQAERIQRQAPAAA